MLSRPERRQLVALLSRGGHGVEKSCVRRTCGTIVQEITVHHSWMAKEHRLEMKVAVASGDLLFMGKVESIFPEHEDAFFAALSDRAPDDQRPQGVGSLDRRRRDCGPSVPRLARQRRGGEGRAA